jgi:spoIIIJ-associated protein
MRSIESDGDTIDQAIDKALSTLNVGRSEVQVEILTDATRGLLGFGGKKARIRATVRPPLSAHLEGSEAGLMDSRETISSPGEVKTELTFRAKQPGAPATHTSADALASEVFQSRCKSSLEGILSRLGVSSTVEIRPDPEPGIVVLDVTGDSGGLLIGRRGQTLDALEYLVNRMVCRDEGSLGRAVIDVEHYRERRQEHLSSMARRLAEKAKQTGRPVTLNPMSPRDRRVVHMALQGDDAVTTRSQGDGQFRQVMILPSEGSRKPSRSRPSAG